MLHESFLCIFEKEPGPFDREDVLLLVNEIRGLYYEKEAIIAELAEIHRLVSPRPVFVDEEPPF